MNIQKYLLVLNRVTLGKFISRRYYHGDPFLDFFEKTTGQRIPHDYIEIMRKKHPHIHEVTHDRLQCTLQILNKFYISPLEACQNMHVFSMNPITVDNYGEILKECGFIKINAEHIIRYHTLVKSRTVAYLKEQGLLKGNLKLEEALLDCFKDWPTSCKPALYFPETSSSLLTIRMSVLERYLSWKLSITSDEFHKFCRNYLPMKHRPMSDIKEALNIAENDIKFDIETIRRNGFIISSDPLNTKLIIENVKSIAGLNMHEVLRIEPAILKNNYNSLLKIRDLLEEYRISQEAQRNCLKVFCMNPKSVLERLEELVNLKEYQLLSTHPRVLSMVIHKKKMQNRLSKIQEVKKQCYSLNHLISSSKVFNNYISSFGDKVCGRDIAILISTSLQDRDNSTSPLKASEKVRSIVRQLKKHKYWLHAALNVVHDNLHFLKKKFCNEVILNNCHLLLYPAYQVEACIQAIYEMRNDPQSTPASSELRHTQLDFNSITDDQLLSLALYEIEKKYHFSGDGIWNRQDGVKIDSQVN